MQLAAGSSNCPFRYVNFSIAVNLLRSKSMDWCLYDNGLRLERVNKSYIFSSNYSQRTCSVEVKTESFITISRSKDRSWERRTFLPLFMMGAVGATFPSCVFIKTNFGYYVLLKHTYICFCLGFRITLQFKRKKGLQKKSIKTEISNIYKRNFIIL